MTTINMNTGKRLSIESRKADLKKKKVLTHVAGIGMQAVCIVGSAMSGITTAAGASQCISGIKSKNGKSILGGLLTTAFGVATGIINIKNGGEFGEIYANELFAIEREERALENEEASVETDKVIKMVNGQ